MASETSARGFAFLELPPELRLQIYSHLLLPELSDTNQIRIGSQKGTILRSSHRPNLALTQTCRQLKAECREFFYSHSRFTITLRPTNCFGTALQRAWRPQLPDCYLQLHLIRSIRLLISLDNIEAGTYVDIEAITSRLPSLHKIEIAFAFPRRQYMREDNAGHWARSAALQGVICHIIQAVPVEVDLGWWSDNRESSMLEDWEDGFWRYVCVPAKIIEGMARLFMPLRGRIAECVDDVGVS